MWGCAPLTLNDGSGISAATTVFHDLIIHLKYMFHERFIMKMGIHDNAVKALVYLITVRLLVLRILRIQHRSLLRDALILAGVHHIVGRNVVQLCEELTLHFG